MLGIGGPPGGIIGPAPGGGIPGRIGIAAGAAIATRGRRRRTTVGAFFGRRERMMAS
jgi:hypothetical protein